MSGTRCRVEIIWPTPAGWTFHDCSAYGPHVVHTDRNGVPLCTAEEAAWMAEQHRLVTDGARRTWPGLIA